MTCWDVVDDGLEVKIRDGKEQKEEECLTPRTLSSLVTLRVCPLSLSLLFASQTDSTFYPFCLHDFCVLLWSVFSLLCPFSLPPVDHSDSRWWLLFLLESELLFLSSSFSPVLWCPESIPFVFSLKRTSFSLCFKLCCIYFTSLSLIFLLVQVLRGQRGTEERKG